MDALLFSSTSESVVSQAGAETDGERAGGRGEGVGLQSVNVSIQEASGAVHIGLKKIRQGLRVYLTSLCLENNRVMWEWTAGHPPAPAQPDRDH